MLCAATQQLERVDPLIRRLCRNRDLGAWRLACQHRSRRISTGIYANATSYESLDGRADLGGKLWRDTLIN